MAWERKFKQAFAYPYIAFEANALLVGAYVIAAISFAGFLGEDAYPSAMRPAPPSPPTTPANPKEEP